VTGATTALDYSAGRPSGKAVADAGHDGVIRYAGTAGRRKNITAAEFADMDRNGRGVALVYENAAGDALRGRAAGSSSARAIVADAASIGFPASRPMYFAVDQDITDQMAAVTEYFRGINDVLGVARTGAYGEADVIDALFAAGVISYGWQCAAWSHGRKAKKYQLYQRIAKTYVGGIESDDINAADWGQHNYRGATRDTTTPQREAEPMQVTAAEDGVVYVPTYGKPGLYIQSGYAHNVAVKELTWIGPTPPAPKGGHLPRPGKGLDLPRRPARPRPRPGRCRGRHGAVLRGRRLHRVVRMNGIPDAFPQTTPK
jgi:hypothetical protein